MRLSIPRVLAGVAARVSVVATSDGVRVSFPIVAGFLSTATLASARPRRIIGE